MPEVRLPSSRDELRQLGITVLLQCQHLAEVEENRFLCPMVELRHAVCADFGNRRVQVSLPQSRPVPSPAFS